MPACQIHVQMVGPVMNWLQGSSVSVPKGGMGPPVLKTKMNVPQTRALMEGLALILRMALTAYASHSGLAKPVR